MDRYTVINQRTDLNELIHKINEKKKTINTPDQSVRRDVLPSLKNAIPLSGSEAKIKPEYYGRRNMYIASSKIKLNKILEIVNILHLTVTEETLSGRTTASKNVNSLTSRLLTEVIDSDLFITDMQTSPQNPPLDGKLLDNMQEQSEISSDTAENISPESIPPESIPPESIPPESIQPEEDRLPTHFEFLMEDSQEDTKPILTANIYTLYRTAYQDDDTEIQESIFLLKNPDANYVVNRFNSPSVISHVKAILKFKNFISLIISYLDGVGLAI